MGRTVELIMGETLEELQYKTDAAIAGFREIGFRPQRMTPTLAHRSMIPWEFGSGYVLRPRPELAPTVYQGRVSCLTHSWIKMT